MAQPTEYDPTTEFAPFNPSSFPNLGTKLDVEFGNIKATTDEVRANLALIQRDDGRLTNGIVDRDSLDGEIAAGVDTPTTWVTATAYSVRDSVIYQSGSTAKWYWCTGAHTSGVFATDLAAGLWEEIFDFTSVLASALLSSATPSTIASSGGNAGTSNFASRADHVHPYVEPSVGRGFVMALAGT